MTPPGRGGSARVPAPAAREGGAGGLGGLGWGGGGRRGGSAGGRRREGRGEAAGNLAEAGERGEAAVVGPARGFFPWGGWKSGTCCIR